MIRSENYILGRGSATLRLYSN